MTTKTKDPVIKAFFTEIGQNPDGRPIVVGWEFCSCGQHVSICPCSGGPKEPGYITKMRDREATAKPTTSVGSDGPLLTDEPGKITKLTGPNSVSSPGSRGVRSGRKPKLPTCANCGKEVTDDDADRNDDGTWTCHTCQESA